MGKEVESVPVGEDLHQGRIAEVEGPEIEEGGHPAEHLGAEALLLHQSREGVRPGAALVLEGGEAGVNRAAADGGPGIDAMGECGAGLLGVVTLVVALLQILHRMGGHARRPCSAPGEADDDQGVLLSQVGD